MLVNSLPDLPEGGGLQISKISLLLLNLSNNGLNVIDFIAPKRLWSKSDYMVKWFPLPSQKYHKVETKIKVKVIKNLGVGLSIVSMLWCTSH